MNAIFCMLLAVLVSWCCLLLACAGSSTDYSRTERSTQQTGGVDDSLCYNETLSPSRRARILCASINNRGSGGCSSTAWLVDYTKRGQPVCRTESCPRGMQYVLLMSGSWDCECKPLHAFWLQQDLNQYEGECHEVLRRGPCPESHLLMLEPPDSESGLQNTGGVCFSQPCPDGEYHVTLENGTVHLVGEAAAGASCQVLEQRGGLCGTLGPDMVLRLAEGKVSCVNADQQHVTALTQLARRRLACTRGRTAVLHENGEYTCHRNITNVPDQAVPNQ